MKFATFNLSNSPVVDFFKSLTPPVIWNFLYKNLIVKDIPDAGAYAPHYSPWRDAEFEARAANIREFTGLSSQKLYTLEYFAKCTFDIKGDVAELGVWKGGSARFIADIFANKNIINKTLYLFDSFEGMKKVTADQDRHDVGDFSDTSLLKVKSLLAQVKDSNISVVFKQGWVPETFASLEKSIFSFVHLDLDLYEPIRDSLLFIYPRLSKGGVLVFDDYGFASCPGARKAVDEFVKRVGEEMLVLSTGQAIVVKARDL